MHKDISKTLGLLKMALNNTDPALSEVRQHIRQAITKLESTTQRKEKAHTQAHQWWGNIVTGIANQPTSPRAAMRSLKELDAMIGAEQKKLNDLERSVREKTTTPSLLQD